MRSTNTTHNHRRPSLRTSGGARSVLLRMAADQERADRIRALKLDRPDLTWRRIADYVGVTERSAADWQVKGGIDYANAEKLAELFEVDVDYIWRGPASTAPDLSRRDAPQDDVSDRLEAIEQALADARQDRDRHATEIRKLLKRQDAILKSIEDSITAEKAAKVEADDARKQLLEAAEAASRIYVDAAQRLAAARDTQAK